MWFDPLSADIWDQILSLQERLRVTRADELVAQARVDGHHRGVVCLGRCAAVCCHRGDPHICRAASVHRCGRCFFGAVELTRQSVRSSTAQGHFFCPKQGIATEWYH